MIDLDLFDEIAARARRAYNHARELARTAGNLFAAWEAYAVYAQFCYFLGELPRPRP